ncbi:MAG: DEAD/DEAH box helicase [Spirochaetales bacterium]|nr:DEAD/DEAH box helicase [Candidatus Physcosoma equi]
MEKNSLPIPTNYRWQEQCLALWDDAHGHGLVEAITGAGKTHLALEAIRRVQKVYTRLKVFVLVPQIALAQQWRVSFLRGGWLAEELSIHSSRNTPSEKASVQIYVINSARFTLSKALLEAQEQGFMTFLVADECHHYSSKENYRAFEFHSSPRFSSKHYRSLGLTATASDKDMQKLLTVIGPKIYHYSLEDGLRDAVIAPFYLYNIAIQLCPAEQEAYDDLSNAISRLGGKLKSFRSPDGDFQKMKRAVLARGTQKEKELFLRMENDMYLRRNLLADAEERLPAAFRLLTLLPAKSKVLVFTEHIQQCEVLCQLLERNSTLGFGKYHSQMDNEARRNALDFFRIGEKRILVCCKALDEGLDVPEADVGIFLSNTDADRQRIQRVGRLLRKSEGKEASDLYYFYAKDTIESSEMVSQNECISEEIQYTDCFKNSFLETLKTPFFAQLKRCPTEKEWNRLNQLWEKVSIGHDYFLSPEEIQRKKGASGTRGEWDYYLLCYALRCYFVE